MYIYIFKAGKKVISVLTRLIQFVKAVIPKSCYWTPKLLVLSLLSKGEGKT